MILLSDMPFIKHEACTKVNLYCTNPLFPITKMVELLLLSHGHVCNIMCIKRFARLEIAKQSKKISNDHELIQSDPISCSQNQKGNNYIKNLTAVYENHAR